MNATTASQVPHFDTFNIGFNVWLSKNVQKELIFIPTSIKIINQYFMYKNLLKAPGDDEFIHEFFKHFNNVLELAVTKWILQQIFPMIFLSTTDFQNMEYGIKKKILQRMEEMVYSSRRI